MTSAPDAPTPLAPPTAAELCAFIEPLLSLARQAGAEIMAVYANPIAVELKADDSPLTAADLRSHRVISQGLRRLTPTIPVISEEATVAASAWGECYWLVDPLDGTKEFVAQNGEFTINIALVVAGEPVLGLIGIPVADTWVVGIPGVLAQQQIGVNPPSPIHTQAYTPTRALRVLASRSHGSAALTQFLARLPSHTRMSAGSALKFVRIASGVRAGLSARDTGDGVRRPCSRLRFLWRSAVARHLR